MKERNRYLMEVKERKEGKNSEIKKERIKMKERRKEEKREVIEKNTI